MTNAAEMKPLVSLTGHISSFYELMRVTQHWAEQEGNEWALSTFASPMISVYALHYSVCTSEVMRSNEKWWTGLCLWEVHRTLHIEDKIYSRISAAAEVVISFRTSLYHQLTDDYCPRMPHVGVESDTARAYVSSFYASLAASTVSSPASFEGENGSNTRFIS